MDTLRILVVDDEAGMRHSIRRALRNYTLRLPDIEVEACFEVEDAENGEQALEILSKKTFDLVLLDHKLGGMTGVDVLEQLRERKLDMLVVMITAFATIETAVRATKCGAFDFIAKPFTPDELKETIRKATTHLTVQRQARRLTEEKRRVRFEFISVLGHELKSPLGAIESYLNLLKSRAAGPELASYDKMVERCLVRAGGMRKLIMDLLDMTRIESGQKQRELIEVDVREVAAAAVESVMPTADNRDISIDLSAEGEMLMTADRGEIEIVLNNLVSNAVKYNRDGGRVNVQLSGHDDKITIVVRDTGIGMKEEDTRKLFKDFVRIKNEKTRDIPGSGLGLSTIEKITQLYGGAVGVESESDVGSTFTVTLKRRPESKESSDGSQRTA